MLPRLLFLSSLLATIFLQEVSGQTTGWSGCINPEDLTDPDPDLVTIGKRHTICLTIGPGGSWAGTKESNGELKGVTNLRYTWRVTADEYSRFHIPKSYDQLVYIPNTDPSASDLDITPNNGNLTVFAASQNSVSFLRVYFDKVRNVVFPFLTAILDVKQGVVQGISWDNACVFCNKERCLENMYNFDGVSSVDIPSVTQPSKGCYLSVEECTQIRDAGGTDCDLTLHVVWTGTDSNNRPFTSSPNRFSAFPVSNLQQSFLNSLPSIDLPFV